MHTHYKKKQHTLGSSGKLESFVERQSEEQQAEEHQLKEQSVKKVYEKRYLNILDSAVSEAEELLNDTKRILNDQT